MSESFTDPYKLRASQLFNVPVEEVTPEQRRYAKQSMYLEIYSTRQLLPIIQKRELAMSRLKAVIEAADALADGSLVPRAHFCGLCINLSAITGTECTHLVLTVSQDWPEYSGCPDYPVRHPNLTPSSGYDTTCDHWSGEYGATRRRLAKFIADWCREHPESAVKLLPLED